ncbi:MAG: heme o synthase [Actinomycetota bacterium]|nr:heme o synthase [Actinomycetota bacterium]
MAARAAVSTGAGTATATRPRARTIAADLFTLTKPKVQSLLLFTTVTTMLVAGEPSLGLILVTCLGGALSAGGAGAINHYLDRDLDAVMRRTSDRPIPSGRIPARVALAYGITLGVASVVLLATAVNPLAATLSLGGLVGYVGVYTMWLKRRTPQNIVIGGAAGAVPPLVAWAAVTGSVGAEGIYLFAVVFFWTPPHFWALSLLMKDEYARAGVPMLPVVRGEAETRWQILLYTVVLVAWTALPLLVPALGLGAVYVAAAGLLGTAFLVLAERLRRRADRPSALRTYLFSLAYLAMLFAALVIDARI